MASLAQTLSDLVGKTFEEQDLGKDAGRVTISDRPDLAQFQCNGAMTAAKVAKKNPRELATILVETLQKNPVFSKVEIAGPGFINLNVTDAFLAEFLAKSEGIRNIGQGQLAILDYGGANIAKAMHVGHLRAAIIGDALRRMMILAGYKTLGDVHMGDWGTHMGMLIDDYISSGETGIVLEADSKDEAAIQRLVDDMAARYPRAAGAAKENPELMARAQAATVKLQNKEAPHYPVWQKIREISVLEMQKTYGLLGVEFDLWKGEADVHDYIAPMVEGLREQGLAIESDGACVVLVAQDDDKKEMPPLILYKRDGAVMYGTTDLGTIIERVKLYNPDKIVYIVDQRQALHFEQVFRVARLSQMVRENVELTHAGFGTMNGADGKPFKTRAGGVMRLDDLISMATEKAFTRMEEAHIGENMDAAEKADIANKVAIAAIKFADLQNARQADYVFDLDRLTSFEGKTGPYLLYQAVRIKSLLRKAEYAPDPQASLILHDVDRPLALLLTGISDSFENAVKQYAPHHLCDYIYRLAQAFSSFYGNCHILSEEDQALRNSRLSLCARTYRQLELGLNVLGIGVPERM